MRRSMNTSLRTDPPHVNLDGSHAQRQRPQREPGPLNEVGMSVVLYAAFLLTALLSANPNRIAPGPPEPNVTVN